MSKIKFDLNLPDSDFTLASSLALRAEQAGFHSMSLSDHFFTRGLMAQPTQPHLECYTTLAALAAVTKTIRLVPMVTAMSYRNPALLAKMTSTLDHISGGRLTVGVGAGWFREEYLAYNYPYPSNVERIERLDDGIKLIKTMWAQAEATYHGRFYSVDKAFNFPKPVQKPRPPILIGGSGKKLLEVAALHADIINLIPPVTRGEVLMSEAIKFDKAELGRRIAMLREFAGKAGRDPKSIEISGFSYVLMAQDRSQVDAMAQMMAATLGLPDAAPARTSPQVLIGTPDEVKREIRARAEQFDMTYHVLTFPAPETIDLFIEQVMPAFA